MRIAAAWIVALTVFSASAAYAATSATAIDVSATVVTNCQIIVSDLAFGAYDPLGANRNRQLDGSGAVQVRCTRSASASIAIDAGHSGSSAYRSMTSGSDEVAYQLYRDANRTRAWTGESDAVRFVASSSREPQQITVYARIPAGQQVPSGRYTDVVRATVYF